MNGLALLSFALVASLSLALPFEHEQIREKRQMGLYGSQFGSPYGSFGAFPSMGMGSPYGSMMYQRSVPMMPIAYAPSLYSPMSMGTLGGMGYGATNPSFMNMGFRARNRH